MNNEYLFNQQVQVELVMFDPSEISELLVTYEKEAFHCILNEEFDLVEEHLSNLFFAIVKKENVNHLLILKTFYTIFICDLFHLTRLKEHNQLHFIVQPFALISTIQQWNEVSHFLSSIPWIIKKINEILVSVNHSPHHSQLVAQAINVIHQQIKNPDLSVQWLAEQLDVTPAHLSYTFSQQNGFSLSSFIRETKINAVLFDIEYSNLSLKEIAEEYNFRNYSNFIRSMKKQCGITPTQYKKNCIAITADAQM
ncbi:helix-turn-helix domain-containing protein [Salisediminibacterium beveridgei]|uniref:Two-component response regulator yesN n=1 Tax=Salisediminibacterium beveridgei TaxID=632773 RepID=A0A1D7QXX2_9BACI|nr:helix-turn-helix domain-containing protein [Salisediminibacterium beveridgei]AOM83856.1 Two-component response regulator yesN [Salisediminibacterium beveridgei]